MHILEQLMEYEKEASGNREQAEIAHDIKMKYGHWLLHFPTQCVLTAEAVLWQRTVQPALLHQDRHQLATIRYCVSLWAIDWQPIDE